MRLITEHSPKAARGDGKRQGFVAAQFRDALSQCAQLEAWLSRHSLLTSVDRDWQNQGLHRYSTSALFEALHRFGIPPGGEEAFRAWAASRFPVEVASLWRK
ncbi:MAG TPA: hypothetical protein VEZ71_20640, partial [Archangium sp.]|nr:hypothetical protein [Archangium sp.]